MELYPKWKKLLWETNLWWANG